MSLPSHAQNDLENMQEWNDERDVKNAQLVKCPYGTVGCKFEKPHANCWVE